MQVNFKNVMNRKKMSSDTPLFRPVNDLILKIFSQVIEIIGITGYANDQVAVFFGMFLRVAEGVGRYHVELYVVTVHLEITPD